MSKHPLLSVGGVICALLVVADSPLSAQRPGNGSGAVAPQAGTTTQAGTVLPELFVETVPQVTPQGGPDRAAVRSRWVAVDFNALLDTLQPQSGGTAERRTLQLTLFPGAQGVAALDRVERTTTGYVWVGRMVSAPDSSVTLAVTADILAGTVALGNAVYTIRHAGNGVYLIQEVDQSRLPPEAPPVDVPDVGAAASTGGVGAAADALTAADDGSVIDVLVAYTPAARSAQGGTSSIEALIDLGISETNQAYANSGGVQRVRLVHKQEVSYAESGDISIDLGRLRNPTDGFLDSVQALRDTYGADVVQLIENSPDACGISYLMTTVSTSFASSAFGITHYSCVSPNYSFAHEMGHNMGLHHDIYVTGTASTGAYAFSRGYVNQAAFSSTDTSKRWRDIMAYNDQCAASRFNCTRLKYFSNPANSYNGDRMGNASTADGVQTLNATRVTVANFRASVVVRTRNGDFDSNGVPDLVWQQDGTNVPALWYMGGADGSSLLSSRVLSGPLSGWRIVGVADLNVDGHPDLVWQQDGSNVPAVWYMGGADGGTLLSAKALSGPLVNWRIVGVADLDGNGHPDLVFQQDGTNVPAVWYMAGADGSAFLRSSVLYSPLSGWRIVGVADVNVDGHPDLVWQQDGSNVPAVWYMGGADGGTLLSAKALSGPLPSWRIVGVADLDGNGHPDLIWQQDGTNVPAVWYMAGADGSTFLRSSVLYTSLPGWRIAGPK